jgi:uncharacterized membrane protein
VEFTNTVTIDRPANDVFAFLTRFENVPLWNYAISETRQLGSGPVAVGTRYTQTRTIPSPAVEEFEVTALDPDRWIAINGALGPFHGDVTYALEASGGSTTLTNTMVLHPTGALRLVAGLAGPGVRRAVAENLQVLKRLLEQG